MKLFTNTQIVFDRINNKKFYTLTIALSALLCCFNGSVVSTNSSEASAEPDINFHGTLEDHAHSANVESILIGGKYESIPVYQQVIPSTHHDKNIAAHQEIDPKQNKILINLQDIKFIALEHPNNPTTSSIQVNNKTYIQIVVESLHGTKKKYLVESTRKITCKEIDKSAEIQDKPTLQVRDVNFIHVKKLTIKGFKSNHPYTSPQISPISKESEKPTVLQEKKDFKDSAAELLHAIEENVKNLPMDNPSAFETMQATILTLLKSLRDQLQKFLDMIK
jgi:hypothetical protein